MEERRAQLASLHTLLQSQALPTDALPSAHQQAIASFTASLLSHSAGGQSQLLKRITELTRVSALHVQQR